MSAVDVNGGESGDVLSAPYTLNISTLNAATFGWLSKLLRVGAKKGNLTLADLPALPKADRARDGVARFEEVLRAHKAQWGGGKSRERRWALAVYRTFAGMRLYLLILFHTLNVVAHSSQPFVLRALITFLDDDQEVWVGLLLAALFGLTALLNSLTIQQSFWVGFRFGMHLKTAASGAVYRKALRLSTLAFTETTTGQITTLIANDVQRLEFFCGYGAFLYSGLLQFAVCAALLIIVAGPAALAGIGTMLVVLPLQIAGGRLIGRFKSRILKHTDARVKTMNEALQGMRACKLNAWEGAVRDRIAASRDPELHNVRQSAYVQGFVAIMFFFAPGVSAFVTFLTISQTSSSPLLARDTFAVLALFNLLIKPLELMPRAMKAIAEGLVSMRRIGRFMALPELSSTALPQLDGDADADMVLHLENLHAKRDSQHSVLVRRVAGSKASLRGSSIKPTDSVGDGVASKREDGFRLKGVTCEVRRGGVVMVVGEVGAGKSSLLAAILGEMAVTGGSLGVARGAEIGYVPQQPWILNMSLRNNILFGRPMDEAWYSTVVECCSLVPDIAMLPGGDETEIGERGVNLSGGQRARVSLARALYGKPALLLLDDPLSAVDAHVGRALMRQCVLEVAIGQLNCGVLIATHQTQFASESPIIHVLVLDQGEVTASGSYATLRSEGVDLAKLEMAGQEGAGEVDSGSEGDGERKKIKETEKGGVKEITETEKEDVKEKPDIAEGEHFELGGGMDTVARQGEPDTDSNNPSTDPNKLPKHAKTNGHGVPITATPPSAPRPTNTTHTNTNTNTPAVVPGAGSRLTTAEDQRRGTVGRAMYLFYAQCGGGLVRACVIALLMVLMSACRTGADFWLSRWVRADEAGGADTAYYVRVYGALTAGTMLFGMLQAVGYALVTVAASAHIHEQMVDRVLNAPLSFFDTTPLGQVLNRFSKDQDTVDELLPQAMLNFLRCVALVGSAVVSIAAVFPAFLAVLVPLYFIYRHVTLYFRCSNVALKRIDNITRSPVFSLFSSSLSGLSSIRAYNCANRFDALFVELLTGNFRAHWLWQATGRWLGFRLDGITIGAATSVALFVVLFRDSISSGLAGVALVYALQLTGLFQWGFRQMVETQTFFTSVERAHEYTQLPQERAAHLPTDPPASEWPNEGRIEFQNVTMRYRPGLEPSLRGITFTIPAGIKVGVVGRTGAGKSSLANVLFRIVEADAGCVRVDGVDIASLGLHTLRSRMTMIPQDPTLFAGSVQTNLDPFGQYTHAELESALTAVHLDRLLGPLTTSVAELGGNISAGQKQLLCLGRALLNRCRVLVMDEATANVDMGTDRIIQAAIRSEFTSSTVFTVAHRLHTIIDYDRVLVMDRGSVVEYGTPKTLLAQGGVFAELVDATGDGPKLRAFAAAQGVRGGDQMEGEL